MSRVSLHVARELPDARGRNLMAQKLNLLLAENRLERVDGQTVLMETANHLLKMLSVRGVVGARNQKVVEVEKNEGQTSQDVVHHVLECGAGIAQTKKACGRT